MMMAENQESSTTIADATSSTGPGTGNDKVIDLLDLCRRTLAEWQYYSPSIQYGKLIEIELNAPYVDPQASSAPVEPVPSTSSAAASISAPVPPGTASVDSNLKCTKYTVCLQQHGKDDEDHHEPRTTFKNFFDAYPAASTYSLKKKERIYWGIRLRYVNACSRRFVDGIHTLGRLLKEKHAYVGWKLPNGQLIPFENLWIGYMLVTTTTKLLMVRTICKSSAGEILSDVTDPFDHMREHRSLFQGEGIHPAVSTHVFGRKILVAKHVGDDGVDVIDPVSMQFNVRGPSPTAGSGTGAGGLIMYGSWEEYEAAFPGQILYKNLSPDAEAGVQGVQVPGMAPPPTPAFVEDVIAAVLRGMKKDCCSYCGEIERQKKEGLDQDAATATAVQDYNCNEIKLHKCANCMRVQYCDIVCQKADWTAHKGNCKKPTK